MEMANENSNFIKTIMKEDLESGKHKVMCLNDGFEVNDFVKQRELLLASFAKRFPKKSSFER